MTRTICLALAAAILLPASGFAAGDPVGAPATASAHPVKKVKAISADDIICKTVPEPGSRISSERVCMTRGEWDQQGATARNALMGSHPGDGMQK